MHNSEYSCNRMFLVLMNAGISQIVSKLLNILNKTILSMNFRMNFNDLWIM